MHKEKGVEKTQRVLRMEEEEKAEKKKEGKAENEDEGKAEKRGWLSIPNTMQQRILHISKMYFSHWEPLGVSERMWSVNLEASI